MEFNRNYHPALLIIILLSFFVAGLFISQFLILITLYPILGDKVFITLFFFKLYYSDKIVFFKDLPKEILFLITTLSVIVSMPANAWIAEQNMQMTLPPFLSELEQWMSDKEAELKMLTEYLTEFQTNGQILIGVLVIALIPAVGEELLFRGGLQNLLKDWLQNKHLAVWIAAIIFSGIHMQFYGFFPRMFLGALFGYLYLWSGNILIPMTGHFVNNGFTVLLIHMKNINKIEVDLETTQDIPTMLIIVSGVLFSGLLFYFYSQSPNGSIKKARD